MRGTVAVLASVAAMAGYYLWQRSRYERDSLSEAHGRALADTAALIAIAGSISLAGFLATRTGLNPNAMRLIGAVIGALLSGPTRRAVLIWHRLDPRGIR